MKRAYTVHSYQEVEVEVIATHEGVDVPAKIKGYVAELLAPDGSHTFTYRDLAKRDDAAALFVPGAVVNVEITAAS